MMYLYIFSVRATFLKFVFFWKFRSDLKNEKQEKNEKGKKQKKNRGVITGWPITACYIYCRKGEKKGMRAGTEPWSPVRKASALATTPASCECNIIVLTVL